MKQRLKGAQKGHSLLKKKSDALTLKFRKILKTIIEVKAKMWFSAPIVHMTNFYLNIVGAYFVVIHWLHFFRLK